MITSYPNTAVAQLVEQRFPKPCVGGSSPSCHAIMKETNYKQCALKRNDMHHMAWIPEKFAVVGKFIKIKKDDKTWEDGWEVMSDGGDHVMSSKDADFQSQLYKKTRKYSDI